MLNVSNFDKELLQKILSKVIILLFSSRVNPIQGILIILFGNLLSIADIYAREVHDTFFIICVAFVRLCNVYYMHWRTQDKVSVTVDDMKNGIDKQSSNSS